MVLQKQKVTWLILGVLLLVLFIQLRAINRPYGGHFGSYQCVMAAMARNYINEDVSQILLPKLDSILEGKKALHLNQFPFPSLFVASTIKIAGGSIEFWGRFQSVIWNLLSAFLIALIGRRLFDRETGIVAAVIFMLSPYTLIYGQCFMSEPFSLFTLLLGIYFYLLDRDKPQLSVGTLASALCFSIAITGRIHFILGMPAVVLDVLLRHKGKGLIKFLLLGLGMGSLPLLWYGYTYFVSVDTPNVVTNIFLQASSRSLADQNYLLSPDYYKRLANIFCERFMTPLGFVFFVSGFILIFAKIRKHLFFVSFVMLNLLLLILSAQKVMDHDFYLYAVFPFFALAAGYGVCSFFKAVSGPRKPWMVGFFFLAYMLLSARYFAHPIYKDDTPHQHYAAIIEAIDQKMDKDERIVLFGRGPAIMAYYSDRPYWVMDPNSKGRELAYYLRNPNYRGVSLETILKEEQARESFVTWLDYLRMQGANYFVAYDKRTLEDTPELMNYLNLQFEKISNSNDSFYLFKLK